MLLDVRNLSGGYRGVGIVDDVSFSMVQGDTLALLGRNGVGKTTLLRTIMGLADRTHGEVIVAGTPVARRSPASLARLGVTFVPDTRGLFPRLTVAENIRLARLHAFAQSAVDVLAFFPDLVGRLNQAAGTLSGGLQQQVAIARALA
ncbi:ATP-binding cassette domain-containing protein, partial [Rhizobiaceae sp. 2RAB30]